jgi:AcrR family transcriptional regulator
MQDNSTKNEGLRERKKRETLQRIAETGLRLFIARGYEGTTLEAIAEAAGISRRTFFYYFKSKEEVLLAWQGSGFLDALRPAMLEESSRQAPFDAVRHCLLKLISRYETKESIIVDRLLRSTEALRARKQAIFIEMEEALFAAMRELWPQPQRRTILRMVAMVSMGAMRLAVDDWRQAGGKRSLADYLTRYLKQTAVPSLERKATAGAHRRNPRLS